MKTTVFAEAVVIDCEEVSGVAVVGADAGVIVADGSIDFG